MEALTPNKLTQDEATINDGENDKVANLQLDYVIDSIHARELSPALLHKTVGAGSRDIRE